MVSLDSGQAETAVSTGITSSRVRSCLERTTCVRLADGAEVLLRAALPEDAARLREMFFHLGDDTRYYYFFTGVPATDHWAQRFTTLGDADGVTSYVLLAQVEERVVGLARFDRTAGTTEAELGILLEDGWQSRGLGQRMIARLAEEALARGITTVIGRVLGENRRALALARRSLPGVRIAWTPGEFELRACLEPASNDANDTDNAADKDHTGGK